SALLDIDPTVIEALFLEQFKGKEKLIGANKRALALGRDWVLGNVEAPPGMTRACGLQIKRADKVGDRIYIEGNQAAALGAVYGGATVCAWYPLTPSSSLADAFTSYCSKLRHDKDGKAKYAIIQGEDEIASIGIVVGAGWNGARAFTATSGPGISLMQEFCGLAYFAEIPAVIFNVPRAGPSTGTPARPHESAVISPACASHGDTKHVALSPQDAGDTFEFSALSSDLPAPLQTPIFVLMDLEIGMNYHLAAPLKWDDR